jgi:DNA-binding transcriptional regulator YiaG
MTEWKPVVDWEGLYDVSNDGQVRTLPRSNNLSRSTKIRVLRPGLDTSTGYRKVVLSHGSVKRTRPVHVLVAEAFLGPRPDGLLVRHLNGNPLDNRASNLAWGTWSENELDAVRDGVHYWANKTHCPLGHPYDEANTRIKGDGRRRCRVCLAEQGQRYSARPEVRERTNREKRRRRAERRREREAAAERLDSELEGIDLAQVRRRCGIPQRAIAEALGTSQASVSMYESRRRRPTEGYHRVIAGLVRHLEVPRD